MAHRPIGLYAMGFSQFKAAGLVKVSDLFCPENTQRFNSMGLTIIISFPVFSFHISLIVITFALEQCPKRVFA